MEGCGCVLALFVLLPLIVLASLVVFFGGPVGTR
jgi:hypothetical protein